MSVVDREIIAATTDAATSGKFNTIGTQCVMCGVLVDDETVTLEQTHDGSTWQTCRLNGVDQVIDINHTMLPISGPGVFRCVKSVTASPVSVMLWETETE